MSIESFVLTIKLLLNNCAAQGRVPVIGWTARSGRP
jgi:hypothetical protein